MYRLTNLRHALAATAIIAASITPCLAFERGQNVIATADAPLHDSPPTVFGALGPQIATAPGGGRFVVLDVKVFTALGGEQQWIEIAPAGDIGAPPRGWTFGDAAVFQ